MVLFKFIYIAKKKGGGEEKYKTLTFRAYNSSGVVDFKRTILYNLVTNLFFKRNNENKHWKKTFYLMRPYVTSSWWTNPQQLNN